MKDLVARMAVVVAVGLVLSGCGKPAAAPAMPPPQVAVALPLRQSVVDWDDFTGRFEAAEQVQVRARAAGYLQAAHFREGQTVRKGQLLFTLDPRPAQAQLAAARAQAGLARADLARAQALLKDQAVSREEFDSRRAAAQIAEAAVRARELDLEFTRVTAPVSGVVSYRRVDPGNVISGGGSEADVLTTIVSTSPIHFVFDASEGQLLRALRERGGAGSVQIRLQDEGDYRWTGRLDFTDSTVDADTGSVRMRAVVANPNGFLKPGMFGNARVEGGRPYQALLVPETAIVTDGPRRVVHVVAPDGSVTTKALQLGPASRGLRVVRAGLRPDDRVVVGGVQRVMPGIKVQAKLTRIEPSRPTDQVVLTAGAPAAEALPAGVR